MTPESHPTLNSYSNGGAFTMIVSEQLRYEALAQGITEFNPDLEAMHLIAEHIAVIEEGDPLPPLIVFGRSAAANNGVDGRWLQVAETDATFYPGINLENDATLTRDEIVRHAQNVGAHTLHEMDIDLRDPRASLVTEFAKAISVSARRLTVDAPLLKDASFNMSKRALLNHTLRQLGSMGLAEPFHGLGPT